jgi:hypothetical protein
VKRRKQHRLWIWRRDGNSNNIGCGFGKGMATSVVAFDRNKFCLKFGSFMFGKEMEMAMRICVNYAKAWNFI